LNPVIKDRLRPGVDDLKASRPTIGSAVFQCMNTIPLNDYNAAFSIYRLCVDANGEYFEEL
jgi:hypothetical protein